MGWSWHVPRPMGALALACLGLLACGSESSSDAKHPLLQDARISDLIGGGRLSYYDRDTQDMVTIQVEKLNGTGGDPLKRAKEELGQMGSEAAVQLRRVFDANFTNQRGIPFLENALDAAALNPSDEAHDMVMAALDHPMEAVRSRALAGLISAHARPGDFHDLQQRFLTNDSMSVRRKYLRAMFRADRERAEQAALDWIQRGEHEAFLVDFVKGLGGSKRKETGLLAGILYKQLPLVYQPELAVIAANLGDASALEFVRAELRDPDSARQMRAAQAFGSVGMYAEIQHAVLNGATPNVRMMAQQNLALGAAQSAEVQDWMASGLTDPNAKMRDFSLAELCRVGYPSALDQALAQLKGRLELLQPALLALQPAMRSDPALARRAFDVLSERYRDETAASDAFPGRTLKALGLVPGRASAEFLRQRALEWDEFQVDGIRAHRWIMVGASNTGVEGLGHLYESLASETDPYRRIDLIDAIASVPGDASRSWLLELLESGQDPYEGLFTAAQLIRMGPSRLVAPRVSLYCLGLEHVECRQALQAMMWEWY